MDDTISRQAAIEAVIAEGRTVDSRYLESEKIILEADAVEALAILPSAQQNSCEGCKHLGKWKAEVEYGYPSPCTNCRRTAEDCYER